MISKSVLVGVAHNIEPYADQLIKGMAEALINTVRRQSMFLGQIYVESDGFRRTRENLNYAADSDMMKQFIKWGRIGRDEADRFGRTREHPADQKKLANILYGREFGFIQLGNVHPNDGWDFRGGGLKQITGRSNYTAFSREYFGDDRLLTDPSLINLPSTAVASAIWFWSRKKLNQVADTGSVESVTKIVNGGQVGLEQRKFWTDKFARALA